jgi:hypothetical protein
MVEDGKVIHLEIRYRGRDRRGCPKFLVKVGSRAADVRVPEAAD